MRFLCNLSYCHVSSSTPCLRFPLFPLHPPTSLLVFSFSFWLPTFTFILAFLQSFNAISISWIYCSLTLFYKSLLGIGFEVDQVTQSRSYTSLKIIWIHALFSADKPLWILSSTHFPQKDEEVNTCIYCTWWWLYAGDGGDPQFLSLFLCTGAKLTHRRKSE